MKTRFLQDVSNDLKTAMCSPEDYKLAMAGLELELDDNNPEIRSMLTDYISLNASVDLTSPFSLCKIIVECVGVEYHISISGSFVMKNYCQCEEDDPDYDYEKQCCGKDCDFVAPHVSIIKCIRVADLPWPADKNARDLWEIERKYNFTNREAERLASKAKESNLFLH